MPLPTPRPPGPDGNPPPYDAMKNLAERCAKAEAELERVTADRDNETKWAKQYHDDWVNVRDELERVKIERDEALVARDFADAALEMTKRCTTLQPDAGSDYISKDAVKPLVEALRHISTDDRYPHPVVLKAIEHAKSLGL